MNKFKFYIVAAVLASGMTLTSCGDSFLNPDPASKGAAGAAGDRQCAAGYACRENSAEGHRAYPAGRHL